MAMAARKSEGPLINACTIILSMAHIKVLQKSKTLLNQQPCRTGLEPWWINSQTKSEVLTEFFSAFTKDESSKLLQMEDSYNKISHLAIDFDLFIYILSLL